MRNLERVLTVQSSFMDKGQLNLSTQKSIEKITRFHLQNIHIDKDTSIEDQDRAFEEADGLLLTGGLDIDPVEYGEGPHPATDPDKLRDLIEIRLLRRALEEGKPVLGICRGKQAMAVVLGGKLVQHIPDEFPEEHGVSIGITDPVYPSSVKHDIIIKSGTQAFEIFATDRLKDVPSRHHQAVREPNPEQNLDFIASGYSPGGVVEIIEHKYHPFYIGIQTHPEFIDSMDPLFEAFSKKVKAHGQRRPKPLAA